MPSPLTPINHLLPGITRREHFWINHTITISNHLKRSQVTNLGIRLYLR
jgi:hypothetical protein